MELFEKNMKRRRYFEFLVNVQFPIFMFLLWADAFRRYAGGIEQV